MTSRERLLTDLQNAKRYIERAQTEQALSEDFDIVIINMIDAAAQTLDSVYNIARLRAEQISISEGSDEE